MTSTRTIRANVAPESLRRVTRFFNRSIEQILTELMQTPDAPAPSAST